MVKDSAFVADLAKLRNCLDDLSERCANPVIFIRGDGNVNKNNKVRVSLLQQLVTDYKLNEVDTGHPTYHHFVGRGSYHSSIDILLYSSCDRVTEKVENILCIHEHPELLSHHDVILSSFTIPCEEISPNSGNLVTAPRCNINRNKIFWSEDGQAKYSELVSPYLREVRNNWLNQNCQASMSVLISVTNKIMSKCATITNQSRDVPSKIVVKSRKVPRSIRNATNKMITAHRKFKITEKRSSRNDLVSYTKTSFICTKKKYRQAVRQQRVRDSLDRYKKLDNIFTNPTAAYSYLRTCRNAKPKQIEQLSVGSETYTGPAVCDGFYASMTSLK